MPLSSTSIEAIWPTLFRCTVTFPPSPVYLIALSTRFVSSWSSASVSPSTCALSSWMSKSNITPASRAFSTLVWNSAVMSSDKLMRTRLLSLLEESNLERCSRSLTISSRRMDCCLIRSTKRPRFSPEIFGSSMMVSDRPRIAEIGVFSS